MATPSWRRVNYGLRPAKNVERKLMAEGFSRLERLHPLAEYRYIGMGSLFFADFSLFHRRLGVTEMHSIEDTTDLGVRQRFSNNKPFDTQVHFAHTNSVLPKLFKPGEPPSLVWLDYDEPIDSTMLADIELVVGFATAPSAFAVSVNVEPGDEDERLQRLKDRVGDDMVPAKYVNNATLGGSKMLTGVYEIINAKINSSLATRNAVITSGQDKLAYKQIYNFAYADGAKMLTVGGVVYTLSQQSLVDQCALDKLDYSREGSDPFKLTVPVLTTREALALDAQLPTSTTLTLPGVPPSECDAYSKLYRFLPSYVDADL